MNPKAYVETSVVSYYTARPSRDLVVAAHQEITRDWWDNHLANAQMRSAIENIIRRSGYQPPIICTPEELLGETGHVD